MPMTRREVLAAGAAAAGTVLTGGASPAWAGGASWGGSGADRRRVLRLAHLTDTHTQPERNAAGGLAACLAHVSSLRDRPGLVMTGGDLIMDGFAASQTRTRQQWDLFVKTLGDGCAIPVEHCLGNHDIWGWNKTKSGTTGEEAGWGKRWAMDLLGLASPYRAFERAGWTFVVLDSIRPEGEGYRARLDDEQYEWLEGELARGTTPVLVVSHAPILAGCVLVNSTVDAEKGNHAVSGGLLHQDVKRLRGLFGKHPRVKLCLSGHIHLLDRVEYAGVTYICDGAVSGNWWKGRHQECDEGYGVVDLFDDGSFSHEYVRYGWKAEA